MDGFTCPRFRFRRCIKLISMTMHESWLPISMDGGHRAGLGGAAVSCVVTRMFSSSRASLRSSDLVLDDFMANPVKHRNLFYSCN
jgi:hypothetical protein